MKRFSRRDFGQGAALTLAGGALASAVMLGSGAPPAAGAAARASPPAQAEIDGKLRHIFALYGDRLSDKQRQMLRVVVADHVRMLESIRAVQLHNSDPPAAVLKLIDGSGAGHRE
ncbi:MAG TPA: hypothetical protein VIY50_02895 [Steroidobacteraceae bacterium]